VNLLVAAAVLGVGAYFAYGYLGSSPNKHNGSHRGSSAAAAAGVGPGGHSAAAPPQVAATLLPSSLTAPITGATTLGMAGGNLLIAGGSTTGGTLAPGIFLFDTTSGVLTHYADLNGPLDAASAVEIGSQAVFFGGDSPGAVATVQEIALPTGTAATSGGAVPQTSVLGQLPEPRADSCAVTIGTRTYLIGGDDGTSTDAPVLSTEDGSSFSSVGSLAVPVRSAAAAPMGKNIYVFGGEVGSATGGWRAVDTIQVFDTRTGKSHVVGHLPQPLSDEAAVSFAKGILVFGGLAGSGQPTAVSGTSTTGEPASNTILWYSGSTHTTTLAAQLPVPVAGAAVAVSGSTVWVVGGESAGSAVSAIQSISLEAR